MTVVVQDTYNEATTTAFASHTPEVGGAPSQNSGFTGTLHVDGTSKTVRHSNTVNALYYYPPSSPDDTKGSVDFVVKSRIGGDKPAIYLRASTSINQGIRIQANITSNQWTLVRTIPSASVTLGTFNQTLSAGSTHTVSWHLKGTTIKVWIDSDPTSTSPTMTGDTGAILTGQVVAIYGESITTNNTTTGMHLDNLLVNTMDPPVFSVAAAITGTASVGSTLTCDGGTVTGTGVTKTYQWQRNGSDISGETATTYVVASGDAGATITCVVTATNTDGAVTSTSNGKAIPATPPTNITPPVIVAEITPQPDDVLTVTPGTYSASATLTYQWRRCAADGTSCSDISGATGATYALTATDVGHQIKVIETATNTAGSVSATSAGVLVHEAIDPRWQDGVWHVYVGGEWIAGTLHVWQP